MQRRMFVGALSCASTGLLWPTQSQAQVASLNDAINKAGRQRMLSQRVAKGYFAVAQGVETVWAVRVMDASIALFDRQLVELKSYAPNPQIKATYQKLDQAWNDYKVALVGEKPSKETATKVFALANQVLPLAHEGTVLSEQASGQAVGRLVNISGRQRMLSQRLAMLHLGMTWGVQGDTAQADIQKARDEFVKAHGILKNAPENTLAISEFLGAVENQFFFYDKALQYTTTGAVDRRRMDNVFTTSERILEMMDSVTGLYSKLS